MGTSEKQLYKEYQKLLKETGVKQFTDEEYQKAIKRLKKQSNERVRQTERKMRPSNARR